MLQMPAVVKQQIINDAFRTFPDECCGFLLGSESGEERIIEKILIVNNAKDGDQRRRFEITPQDYLKAERYAEENKLTLLGVYHSHPNHPSVPSEHDRVVAQPWFSYVIVSVGEWAFFSIQSWRLNDNAEFEQEGIQETSLHQLQFDEISSFHNSIYLN